MAALGRWFPHSADKTITGILNFTDGGGDPDTVAGGPHVQSNTLNPFSHGLPDQLMNLVVSLMSDASPGNDMWKNRAMSLVSSAMKALCEMRDAGDILLDAQSIRDFLPLGLGFKKELLDGRTITVASDAPDHAWDELRTRGGMIELYIRALNNEFSETSKSALKGFFRLASRFRSRSRSERGAARRQGGRTARISRDATYETARIACQRFRPHFSNFLR